MWFSIMKKLNHMALLNRIQKMQEFNMQKPALQQKHDYAIAQHVACQWEKKTENITQATENGSINNHHNNHSWHHQKTIRNPNKIYPTANTWKNDGGQPQYFHVAINQQKWNDMSITTTLVTNSNKYKGHMTDATVHKVCTGIKWTNVSRMIVDIPISRWSLQCSFLCHCYTNFVASQIKI